MGVFQADFASLDEYLSYIWVPRASSSPNSDHYVAVFPEDSITVPGGFSSSSPSPTTTSSPRAASPCQASHSVLLVPNFSGENSVTSQIG